MGQTAYLDGQDDGQYSQSHSSLPVMSREQPIAVAPSPTRLSVVPTWGVPLRAGQTFWPGQVGAIITKQGLFIWAMPTQYFDTTPGGMKIRLRRLNGPEPLESDQKVAEWNAVGEVARLVMVDELRGRQAGVEVENQMTLPSSVATNQPTPKGRRSLWLQGFVALALAAAVVLTYLVETRNDPATAGQWLLALIGLGGLLIFGVAASAIMHAASS